MGKSHKSTASKAEKGKPVKSTAAKSKAIRKRRDDARIKWLREQIKKGQYETKEKMEIALERLIEDLDNHDENGRLIPEDETDDESP